MCVCEYKSAAEYYSAATLDGSFHVRVLGGRSSQRPGRMLVDERLEGLFEKRLRRITKGKQRITKVIVLRGGKCGSAMGSQDVLFQQQKR